MKEEFLQMLKEKAQKEIKDLDKYNEYAKIRNKLAEEEDIKKELGVPYRNDLGMPLKTEDDIILNTYRKHIGEIEEKDTNGIYYYDGTYKYVYVNYFDEDGYNLVEELVARDDPEAAVRRYVNIEGVYSYEFNLADADEFERTHTIIYNEEAVMRKVDQYYITEDFITTAVKENEEKALELVLKKYVK